MPTPDLGFIRTDRSDGDVTAIELGNAQKAGRGGENDIVDAAAVLARRDQDQLARDIADIERATEALQRADPALRSWTKSAPTARKPRPLWLMIGLLWLSTALIAAVAAVAIATLAGKTLS